jgi:hypothetical protein
MDEKIYKKGSLVIFPKPPSNKRDKKQWEDVKLLVCNLDHWRCRGLNCGAETIQPHHIIFRSQGGQDDITNVMLLCPACHDRADHDPEFVLDVIDRVPENEFRWPESREWLLKRIERKELSCKSCR